jgi:membrane protein
MFRLWVSGIRRHPAIAVPLDALHGLVLHDGFDLAASIAFSALLALFPFLIFLFALGGLVGGHQVLDILVAFLFRLLPGDVAHTLAPVIVDVVTEPPSGLVPVSLVFALWVASSALDALRLSLNHAYNITERRRMWQLKLQSIVFVIFGSCFLVAIAFLVLLGPFLWHIAEDVLLLPMGNKAFLILGQYAVGAVFISFGVALVHLLLPMHRLQLREVLPGAIATSTLWLIAAALFTLYLSRLADYGATYGTFGGIMATLVFFYISAAIFVFGAEFNASVCRWRAGNIPQQARASHGGPRSRQKPSERQPLSARTASPVRWEMGDGAVIPTDERELRQLEEENAQLRKQLAALTREKELKKERPREVAGRRR